MKYSVGFLDNDVVKESITLIAQSKENAFIQAEEIYKVLDWKFSYNDMFCDILAP